MAPPVLYLKQAHVTFGGRPVFDSADIAVQSSDRICLVGRNGSGKSTLLKCLAGEVELDDGEYFIKPGLKVAYLPQDPHLPAGKQVYAFVAEGLVAEDETHQVEAILDILNLDGTRDCASLSGGEGRRAAIARALVSSPDVLLLDEPTNHLDLPTIQWLEEELASFRGAMVMISHDRTFLRRLSSSVVWLDRGQTRRMERGFSAFDAWVDEIIAEEENELTKINIQIAEEKRYMLKGVTARRKRNQRRVQKLADLRRAKADRISMQGSVKLSASSGDSSGKLVIEAENISMAFDSAQGPKVICKDFSTRVMRGDKIGLIGPNGAGKTTLLKILTGKLEPNSGSVRLGTNLNAAYFDQKRANLNPERTVWETLADTGGDSVIVNGQPRHVVSYMRDFLFEERQARTPVGALSGGEKNRLILAKLLANPTNFLILDEPTNDLDMDTLDLLQEVLSDYDGTLLLVSHDRDFLDRVVTSTIAVEGNGEVQEYPGGYDDYLRQRQNALAADKASKAKAKTEAQPKTGAPKKQGKLSYKDQRELDQLPEKIAKLTAENEQIESELANPELFSKNPDKFQKLTTRHSEILSDLEQSEERWLELEMLKEELSNS